MSKSETTSGVFYLGETLRPEDVRAFRFVPPLIVCGHCLMPSKACKQVIHNKPIGIESAEVSSLCLPGSPTLLSRLSRNGDTPLLG